MEFNKRQVELLAPVGSWDVLEAVIAAGADAVYFGGKDYNMRLHRADRNFAPSQLAQAVSFAHAHNVRVYVTVNNLISEAELDGLIDHLKFLATVGPDALIVQDLAVIKLCKDLGLKLPLHASVMMNVHSEAGARALQALGVNRVIASRDLSLTQLALIKERTNIELEYFIHGDMCVAHGGQCLASGILFGKSSNRGRCLKPCRWPYAVVNHSTGTVIHDTETTGPYKLAIKDMCLYRHLPDLIQAGVDSFKIEGRMRPAEFLARIVRSYRQAIDRYLADPTGYTVDEKAWEELYTNRVRDYSPCFAFGAPGPSAFGYSGNREPMFFSHAAAEKDTPMEVCRLYGPAPIPLKPPKLAIRVASLDAVIKACDQGAEVIYVGGEAFKPNLPLTLAELSTAIEYAKGCKVEVIAVTPRITMDKECEQFRHWLAALDKIGPAGILVGNLGMAYLARQVTTLPLYADYSFNIFNHVAAELLAELGIAGGTISLEMTLKQSLELLQNSPLPLEVIIHGPIPAMISEHCLPAAILARTNNSIHCGQVCRQGSFALRDILGQNYLLANDQFCRTHILMPKDRCLLPYLGHLAAAGAARFRIEAQIYTPDQAALITGIYRRELDKLFANPAQYAISPALLTELAQCTNRELGRGPYE